MGSSREHEELNSAQDEIHALLQGRRPLHVTELAAACLRAVDAAALNEMLSDFGPCARFRQVRDEAQKVLEDAGGPNGPNHTVYPGALQRLDTILQPYEHAADAHSALRSLRARALAQALHDERKSQFWSYFSNRLEAKQLRSGDPFPVPSSPTIHEIYRPLRVSPCPDTRDTPHSLCPGGYRGLPSLRLMPWCADGDVYLDPSLGDDVCPLATGDHASGTAAIVIPAEYLEQRYEYASFPVQEGERAFNRVRPRGATEGVTKLIDDVVADLSRGGGHAALAVLPELTSTPELEDAIEDALAHGKLGCTQLVVAGSAWIPANDDAAALGDNRSTTIPREGRRYHHHKFSWFYDKEVGAEHLAHRRKRITILAGRRLTFTTLICKDALETWVPKVLQELRVRLVVVPSCNAGVAAFRSFAMSISDLGWGTVVLANIPPTSGAPRKYALVVRPAAKVSDHETGRVSELQIPEVYKTLILLNITSGESS